LRLWVLVKEVKTYLELNKMKKNQINQRKLLSNFSENSGKWVSESAAKLVSYNCLVDFANYNEVKKHKYLVVTRGDLDINNAMMLKSWKDVVAYVREMLYSSHRQDDILQIFEVKPLLRIEQTKSARKQLLRMIKL
jgi:hypothetical protein